MKYFILTVALIFMLTIPVNATEITAPSAPGSVEDLLQYETSSFSDGLWHMLRAVLEKIMPNIIQCSRICISLVAISVIIAIFSGFHEKKQLLVQIAGTVLVAGLLFAPTQTLIQDAADMLMQLSEYEKLLLPAMAAALAAQGGIQTSSTLYMATAFLNAFLSKVISNILLPFVYLDLILSCIHSATGEDVLKKLRDMLRKIVNRALRLALYAFTGYLSITGVINGNADQMAVKATKLTVSNAVPVVGNILSDASETILISAAMVKSTVGISGLLVLLAIAIGPFLNIGIQYLIIKITAGVCETFSGGQVARFVEDFADAMQLLLAMIGAVTFMMMISTVCFMKGME